MRIKITGLDKKFSQYIRSRDGWTCRRCKKQYTPPTNALHCSHFYGRRKKSVRFDPDNAFCHCYGCHQFLGSNPEEFRRWALNELGQKRYDALMIRANIPKKPDYELINLWLSQELKK